MTPELRRSIIRAVAAAAWAAALSLVLLLAGARWWLPGHVDGPVAEGGWTRRARAAFVPSGFHPAELDASTGRSFSWTTAHARLEIPGLRRTRAHKITLAVRGGRPPGVPLAEVRIAVDGQVRTAAQIPNEPSRIEFEIPRGPSGTVISIDVAAPFVPGGNDRRALGIVIDTVAIEPVNGPFVPRGHAQALLVLTVAMTVLALWCCGLRGGVATAAAVVIAVGFAWLLLKDAAFLGGYVDRLARIGAVTLAIGAAIGVLRLRWPAIGGVPEWGSGAAIVLGLSALKVALFWHPLAIVGDGLFQVHRAMVVHGGDYYFVSVTPKPFFEFPYPIALYVLALPFWNWFPSEIDLLRLLRAVAIAADGVTGVMLYAAVRRQWNSRHMAFAAAVLWPFATAPFQALSNANLTNLFGQSVFGAALAGVAWMSAAGTVSVPGLAGICALLVIAFLSHFGTVTVGLATIGVAGLVLIAMGQGHVRRVGLLVFAVLAVALATSWIVYYSHFTETYRRTWTAVTARESDDSSKIVATPAVKLGRWWSSSGDDYGRPGVPVLLASLAGVALVLRQRRSGGTLVFLAWIMAWLALTALGVLTPLTLRANLAAAPALMALSAVTIGVLASRSRAAAFAAVALTALVAWDGLRVAIGCLRL